MGGLEWQATMRNVYSSGMCTSEVEIAMTMTGNLVSYTGAACCLRASLLFDAFHAYIYVVSGLLSR